MPATPQPARHTPAQIIDGKAVAAALRAEIATSAAQLKQQHGVTPGLAVIQVGDVAASSVYVRNKIASTREAGMHSVERHLPATATEAELLAEIDRLNADPAIHGILVQLPLPAHMSEQAVIQRIDPSKDVDGFHALNAGALVTGGKGFVPCTPLGCVLLLKQSGVSLAGKHAVVVGRSNIVGKPMAALLLREHCTVTIAHSRTADLPAITRQAEILVAAVGQPELIRGDWIRPGAAVIDVGMNRIDAGEGKTRLVGDVHFAEALQIAGHVTPVPGGVGPMTIACLLANTLKSAITRTPGAESILPARLR